MFYVISEILFSNGSVKYEPIGYTTEKARADEAEATTVPFKGWVESNVEALQDETISPEEFLTGKRVFCCGWETDSLGDSELEQIKDFSFLGGE